MLAEINILKFLDALKCLETLNLIDLLLCLLHGIA